MLFSRRESTASSRRLWTDPRLAAYTIVQAVVSPVVLALKLRRHLNGYVGELDRRRWTLPGASVEQNGAVVFVGAGPGELIMIDRLVAEMKAARPDLKVTICLRDLAALDRLRAERPAQRFAVWPFDHIVPVARWIRQEQPALVVFVDRFRFPAFACGLAAAGIRVALVNGRCRRRTSGLYRLSAPFYRWQVSAFDLLSMEDVASAAAIQPYASPTACVIAPGGLKADLAGADSQMDPGLRRWLRPEDDLPLLAAGSTRDLEDERMVLDAFTAARKERPCRLLLAPRKPERAAEVAKLVQGYGLKSGRRSEDEPSEDILLLDTFGELSISYGAARAAYVGGFTGDGGGHNFMEPLRWGVPVAYGPNRGNFASLQTLCEDRGVSRRVRDAGELAAFWTWCLEDVAGRNAMGERGRELIEESRGATKTTAQKLLELMPDREARPSVAKRG